MSQLTISVVSHASGALVADLLADLRRHWPSESELLLTVNVPEDERYIHANADLPITVIRNQFPKGFGENHNQAFQQSRSPVFVIVNPDVRLKSSPFEALQRAAIAPGVGACAPRVLSPQGTTEDSVRRFPTIRRLATRVLLRRRVADYPTGGVENIPIDWAAGMFVAFNREAFEQVNGFDSRYYMYFEDADICRRLWAAGKSVLLVPCAEVIHDARRSSHASLTHLRWHIRSAVRFLLRV